MALPEGLILEYRSQGDPLNGGGFTDLDPGTSVDYTQRDAPVSPILTDVATDVAGTQLSSVAGGWTAAMVGNVGYSDGTSAGWYQITNFVDTNTIDIDRSAGGSQSGLTFRIGGALSTFTDAFLEAVPDYTVGHIKDDGDITLLEAIIITNAPLVNKPMKFYGYKNTRRDNPVGADKPKVNAGAFNFWFPDSWHFKDIEVTGTATKVFQVDTETVTENCKVTNTSGTANRVALSAVLASSTKFSHITRCVGISDNGTGIELAGNVFGSMLLAKDCGVRGIKQTTAGTMGLNKSIIYNCPEGIDLGGRVGSRITQCTIDDCSVAGILLSSGSRNITVERCNITNNLVGINGTADDKIDTHRVDYNNFYNNGTDRLFIHVGDNDFSIDPEYIDAVNGDLNVGTAINITFDFPEGESQDVFNPGALQSISPGGETAYCKV